MTGLFPTLPVFLDLAGRAVIVIGAHAALDDLAERCAACGAGVRRFAARSANGGRRTWRAADLRGAALVAMAPDAPRATRARLAARAAGAMFVKIDAPAHSDIALGAAGARGMVSIGVDASGAPGAVARAVERAVTRRLPPQIEPFAAAAAACADLVRDTLTDAVRTDAFWRALAEEAWSHDGDDAPDWRAIIRARLSTMS
ncbi:MAG: hypothetical protein NW203_02515 [Hyphomonadaceae bacterium]|nr:hypothetical protein [Hyphomonadaceae bacterium]